ncbi:MAG: 2-isopropylmalate synthase [Candidatus Omnitrophica bacterium CG11_big_fil_rev_8_21_14_0_20_42_13]|uniref:2-isopropylmalate synthase n=1 Tax=Candidatus Ghiorseimicrobium undicola TaxID=1974746 RepID=A0A2H0LWN1_9BACT|nr:MAG: 2-isopropylmalate synthase [Candidatus Omnitrophica bacterium CG11_big_fil_rev_8_21_14_0_20_42_13]
MDKVIIFDTTLRDGEQAPGASLNKEEKIQIAGALSELGVDVIEAGFPVSSKGDFQSVKSVAAAVKKSSICGLARALKKDIDAAYEALKKAHRPRIHVFLATSKIHMKYKLKKAKDEIVRLSCDSVKYASKLVGDVEFSPEDASRTDPEFLFRVVETVIKAGAKTVNIPDTVGYSEPQEYGSLIAAIKNNVPNINKAVISVHCHDDLGLAVANSLSAVKNGARQIECTINGIGERAGNASLEEIVMALKTRPDLFGGLSTAIKSARIYKTSRLVSKLTGFTVAPNKAIVGANAFRHESGIHQDGVLKKRSTYEIISPQDVGFYETGLVLGKHSGRHALKERLKAIGIKLSEVQLARAFELFKSLADKKKQIFDEDLIAIVEDEIRVSSPIWQLDDFRINSGFRAVPEAWVRLKRKGKNFQAESSGDGPVDACYKAIDKITGLKGRLVDYSIHSVTAGKDAQGEVAIKIRIKNDIISARAASTDIIEASAKAYINAINKFSSKEFRNEPRPS